MNMEKNTEKTENIDKTKSNRVSTIINKFLGKMKNNGFSIAVTLLVLVAFVLLNVFVGMLTERFFLRLDITETGIYTLHERAEEFLQNMNESVDVIILAEESTWLANHSLSMISNILSNYAATSGGQIRIQYVNPDLNTFDGPKYGNLLSTLRDSYTELEHMGRNDIIFLSARRATVVAAGGIFQQRQGQTGQVEHSLRADQEFIGALTYVLNDGVARITFVTNHQENSAEVMRTIFERSGFVSQDIDLRLEEIPEDTVLLVSAAPKSDFMDEEIAKLEQFIGLGGNVMIMLDFNTQSLPRLDAFLLEWGMVVEQSLIFDEDFTLSHQFGIIGAVVREGALPSTEGAEAITSHPQGMPLGVRLARPLRSEWPDGSRGGFTQSPLVTTRSDSSYAKNLDAGELTTFERETGDESGPFTLAYNVRHLTRNAAGDQVFANLFVFSAEVFDDMLMSMFADSLYNQFLVAGLANDLNPFGERVFIPPTALVENVMLINAGQARTIFMVLVIILPLLIIAAGIVVWRRRKNK